MRESQCMPSLENTKLLLAPPRKSIVSTLPDRCMVYGCSNTDDEDLGRAGKSARPPDCHSISPDKLTQNKLKTKKQTAGQRHVLKSEKTMEAFFKLCWKVFLQDILCS